MIPTRTKRRKSPRDLAESIMLDVLEEIQISVEKYKAGYIQKIPTTDMDWIVKAHKALTDAKTSDAEVDYLDGMTEDQSVKLEEILEDLMKGNEN